MKILPVLAFALITTASLARPPDNMTVSPEIRDWYQSLQSPLTGGLCCSIADCRVAELRRSPTDPTAWEAFVSKDQFGPTAPDAWLPIPPAVTLQKKTNLAGGPVICWFADEIRCAVLPTLF